MRDRTIRIKLMQFADRIFSIRDIDEVQMIKKEYDKFCRDNKVSIEQLEEFAASGAGEMLHILTSYD